MRDGNRVGEVTNRILVCVLILAVIGAFVALELAGRSVDSFLYLVILMGIPTVASIFSARTAAKSADSAESAAKGVRHVDKRVKSVEQLVNGNTTRLMNELESARADLAEYERRYGRLTPTATIPASHTERTEFYD